MPEMKTTLRDESGRIAYKWIALSVTTIGALMAALDATIVILALPEMMSSLHADLVEMVWVIMAYILASTVLLLTFGRVADMLGRVRLYNAGFVVFTVGSVLCGLAWAPLPLIAFRMIQGSGAALMVVNSIAILTEAFPPKERGRALGINSITWSLGGVLGPVLGGLILSTASWRWIFFINLPIGIAGAWWSYRALHEMRPHSRERFDPPGAASFSFGLTSLLLALTLGIQFRWTSPPILVLFALAVALLAGFILIERRSPSPVLDLSLFNSRLFNFSVLAAMMQALALFAVQFLMIFYMQAVRGFSPLKAALLLIPLPVMNLFTGPLGGWIADRIGSRLPATAGLIIQMAGLVWLSRLTTTTSYVHIAAGLALMGVGGGLFFPSNTSAAMNAAPPNRLGIASGTLATLRQAGMVTSFALSLAVAAASLPRDVMMKLFVGTDVQVGSEMMTDFVVGVRSAYLVSVGLCIVAAAISLVRGREVRAGKEGL